MTRFFAAAAAATLALVPAAGIAQGAPNGYYSATPVSAPAKTSLVTRSTLWKCGAGTCTAATSDWARSCTVEKPGFIRFTNAS